VRVEGVSAAGVRAEGVSVGRKQPEALTFTLGAAELSFIHSAPRVTPEVGVETDQIKLEPIRRLREEFKQRNEQLRLTVNDLLILYRAIHAATYQPKPELVTALKRFAQIAGASPSSPPPSLFPPAAGGLGGVGGLRGAGGAEAGRSVRLAMEAALDAITSLKRVNPALVMPVDAARYNPRDRLYPITFEVPLNDLDLLELHQQVLAALERYQQAAGDRTAAYEEFNRLQHNYLERLGAFGLWLNKAKDIASAGESFSINNINLLLGNLPTPLQRLLDKFPERFDLLNDLIKGREAFSNIGAVAPSSSLTRFISAKDDNEKKSLIWGVVTDARGVMRLSLRDFRPHVALLIAAGHKDVAVRLAQDYLDSYVSGLNQYVRDLRLITRTSRETRLA
jgi:hypothetical protein